MPINLSELQAWIGDRLEQMVPPAADCEEAARKLRLAHPGESPEQLAGRAIRAARQTAAGVGAATGAAGNPITMVPAAVADITAVLRIEAKMAGVICALLDPASLDDRNLRGDVIGVLFPGAVSQVLRQVGVHMSQRAGKALVRKYFAGDVFQKAVRFIAGKLGARVAQTAVVRKAVPFIGAGVGAGWNWFEVGAVGTRALRYYQRGRLPVPESTGERVKALVRRLQPWRKRDDLVEDVAAESSTDTPSDQSNV